MTAWGWIAAQGDNYGLYLDDANCLNVYHAINTSWNASKACTPILTPDNWYHVTGLFDGTHHRLYVNGAEVAQAPEARPVNYIHGSQWTIGSMQGQRLFQGFMRDVRVHGRALTREEIDSLAQ